MNIRISELPVSPGVRILTAPEAVIAHVVGIKEEVVAAPAEGAAPAAAEPEVAVKKGKKEEEAAAPAAPEEVKEVGVFPLVAGLGNPGNGTPRRRIISVSSWWTFSRRGIRFACRGWNARQ